MNYIKLYLNFLKKFINPQRKLRVIFDCSNGVSGLVVRRLQAKNLKFKIINGKPDGNFPAHGPDPLKKNATNSLQKMVFCQKADFGVVFDADGDRVFFIDNKGRFVDQDVITRLLIWHLNPKKIVISANMGWLIKKFQIPIIISKTGHFYIKKLMQQKNADFGAERSGHYYFKKFFYADSGILTAIEIINAVSRLPYSLADFVDLLPQYYRFSEVNIKYQASNIKRQELFKKIEKKYKEEAKEISYIDGLSMVFNEHWFNIRFSNTESLIRLSIEAKNKRVLQKEKKKLIRILNKLIFDNF